MIEGTAGKEGIPITRPDVYICNVVNAVRPKIARRSRMRWKSAGSSCSAS